MNIERFYALMLAVKSDLDATGLLQRLYDLQNALQEVINRQEPHHQEAVGHALRSVREAIDRSEVDRFGPSWKELLTDSGFGEVLGSALGANIDTAYQQNNITPSIAKEEIQSHINELERLNSVADRITDALGDLGTGGDELVEEECEIGVSIPREVVNGQLERFIEELKEFDAIFRIFSEVATEETQQFELCGLAASDYAIYLKTDSVVAALAATAMERVVIVYQQLLEIRRLRTELSAQDVPSEVFGHLDTHVNSKMAKAIEEIAINLVLEYYPSEDGKRARQLVVELGAVLSKLANRFDRGYRLEVRAPRLEAAGEDGDLSLPPHFVAIRQAALALAFVRPGGEAILELSEATKSRKAPTKQKPVTKKVAKKKSRSRRAPSKRKKASAAKKAAPKKVAPAKKAAKKAAAGPSSPPAAEKPAPKKKSRKKKRGTRAKRK